MWLGERITEKGIGNGISLLIMIGIIARFHIFYARIGFENSKWRSWWYMMILLEIVVWFLVILASVLLVTAVRRIAVQYARRSSAR